MYFYMLCLVADNFVLFLGTFYAQDFIKVSFLSTSNAQNLTTGNG